MRIAVLLLSALLVPVAGCTQDEPAAPVAAEPAADQTPSAAAETDETATPAEPAAAAGGNEAPQTLATGEGVPSEAETSAAPTRLAQAEPAAGAPRGSRFVEGEHYKVLTPTQPTSSPPDKIEVAEVFWYGCGHCYTFEPYLTAWNEKKPADVSFVRIPAMWNPTLVVHARAYYTAEALGVLDRLHDDFFRAIHQQGKSLTSPAELAAFFANYDVSAEAFRNAFESFAVETALQRADQLNRRYRISSTPTMVINGKYVTGSGLTGGFQGVLDLVDELVGRERTDR